MAVLCVTECQDPTLDPAGVCVPQGTEFTCSESYGYPGTPNYTLYYSMDGGGSGTVYGQKYAVSGLGNFSLVCSATYWHQSCPECYATCFKNFSSNTYGECVIAGIEI